MTETIRVNRSRPDKVLVIVRRIVWTVASIMAILLVGSLLIFHLLLDALPPAEAFETAFFIPLPIYGLAAVAAAAFWTNDVLSQHSVTDTHPEPERESEAPVA